MIADAVEPVEPIAFMIRAQAWLTKMARAYQQGDLSSIRHTVGQLQQERVYLLNKYDWKQVTLRQQTVDENDKANPRSLSVSLANQTYRLLQEYLSPVFLLPLEGDKSVEWVLRRLGSHIVFATQIHPAQTADFPLREA